MDRQVLPPFSQDGVEAAKLAKVEDELQRLRGQVLGLQGELQLAVFKMTTMCSAMKFDAPESHANPVRPSGEQDAVSVLSLSSQLAALQKDLSQATELHKQSADSAWARADEMFEKATDKVDSFHKYCAGLITRCETRNEKATTSSLPAKVEVATAIVVEPLLESQASQEHAKVLRNLKVLEKEIQDAYAEDHKKFQNILNSSNCEEGHQRNENGGQDCNKALKPCMVNEMHPQPEIASMKMNNIAKRAISVPRRDAQQRSDKGAPRAGSELRKGQQDLVSGSRSNGCSWQASAVSGKSNRIASDSPAAQVRDISQVTVKRKTSLVPPLRLSGLRDVPGDAVQKSGQSARPGDAALSGLREWLSAREEVVVNGSSLPNSQASTSTACSTPGLALSSDGSPRVDLVRFLSCDTAGNSKPKDPKPFEGCEGGPVRMQSARVNRQSFPPPLGTSGEYLLPLSCR